MNYLSHGIVSFIYSYTRERIIVHAVHAKFHQNPYLLILVAHGEGNELGHDIDPVFAIVTDAAASSLLTPASARGLHKEEHKHGAQNGEVSELG